MTVYSDKLTKQVSMTTPVPSMTFNMMLTPKLITTAREVFCQTMLTLNGLHIRLLCYCHDIYHSKFKQET